MAKDANDLFRGNLDLMILSVLADGSKYGYLLQQRLSDVSRGMVSLQAGTLYPILHKLEGEKLVRCRWEETTGRPRKWYELTAKGRSRLTERATQWRDVTSCLEELLSPILKTLPDPA
ncbi:MAG: PadR family transcriptional regulator [Planctomycetota bacterium]|nr:PadR family transcriptional regulator [Planctomycetota bacterium]